MKYSIESQTTELLEGLENTTIHLSPRKTMNIISALKTIPRSGKSTRIDAFSLHLPKRSLYDHILSLAQHADIFHEFTLRTYEGSTLAEVITFHDIAEVITGDVPTFTSKKLAKSLFKTREEKEYEEHEANKLIAESLEGDLKKKFLKSIVLVEKKDDPLVQHFHMLDKTDPIIAIWRYLFLYRNSINIDTYLHAMTDFFTHEKVKAYCIDPAILELTKFLQNKENAKKYFDCVLSEDIMFHFPSLSKEQQRRLFEKRIMHTVSE